MNIKRALLVHSMERCCTTAIVAKELERLDIDCTIIHRSQLDRKYFSGNDLLLVVGGDGTFLRTSHFVKDDTPMFGINCNPKLNEGFYMRANSTDFSKKMMFLINGKARLQSLLRLQVKLDNKNISELALNDIYLGDRRAYHMSRYWLEGEYQKSSGVIVSTPTGSHGWQHSAGGKTQPSNSLKAQFLVREPFCGKLVCAKKLFGLIEGTGRLAIKSDNFEGVIVLDSVSQEYPFNIGTKAEISISDRSIKYVDF